MANTELNDTDVQMTTTNNHNMFSQMQNGLYYSQCEQNGADGSNDNDTTCSQFVRTLFTHNDPQVMQQNERKVRFTNEDNISCTLCIFYRSS